MNGSPSPAPPEVRSRGRHPGRAPLVLVSGLLVAVLVLAVVAALVLGARSRGAATSGAAAASGGRRHAYLLEPAGRPTVRVSLEAAATEAARERGLSHRRELPAGTGMVFLFPGDTLVSFWMKDTLVPLQIAFVAGDGRVVGLVEMAPCRADPCPAYAPGRPYRYAVELGSGAFTAAGVAEGDRVVPQDPSSVPPAS